MISPLIKTFYHQVERKKDSVAITHKDETITFGELAKKVEETSAWLAVKGIKPGDTILIYVPMGIPLYILLMAIWHRAAIAVFVDAWTSKNRLDVIAKNYKIDAFIGIPKAHILRLFSKKIREIPVNMWIFPWWKPNSIVKPVSATDVNADETAFVTFTTGSTGIPKGANRTHTYLLTQNKVLSNHLQLSDADIDLITLPVFLLNNLAQGIPSVIAPFNPAKPESADPELLITTIIKKNITSSAGSPAIYQKLAEYCIENNKTLESLKKIFIGGAPVFPNVAKTLVHAFPNTEIEIVYGSTEAEPISALSANALIEHKCTIEKGLWVGKPVPCIEIMILDIDASLMFQPTIDEFKQVCLPIGEIGEICVTGNHVLKHYYKNPVAERETKIHLDDKVWHRTGDAGYIDENGDLYLMGNVKNRIEHKNSILYLFPYEILLNEIDGVARATLVNINEKLVVAVETDTLNKQPHDAIKSRLDLMSLPQPWSICWVKIPRDPRHNSKIDYTALVKVISETNSHEI